MRLFRMLAHLVLALALIGAAGVQARAVGIVPAEASEHHAHMDHHAAAAAAHHAAPDHGVPGEHPAHKAETCQTACCFVPSQPASRGTDATAVAFFCAVRYRDAAQPRSGRADAPDPGVPKTVL